MPRLDAHWTHFWVRQKTYGHFWHSTFLASVSLTPDAGLSPTVAVAPGVILGSLSLTPAQAASWTVAIAPGVLIPPGHPALRRWAMSRFLRPVSLGCDNVRVS